MLVAMLLCRQQQNTVPLVMASLVIAAVPTLIVFVFCQNIILRGIIVPSFK
jgi:ABC-type glycerol-3-phosphate transport system permease component